MTPAEFNHVGNQSQLEIFEGYFEDYNQLSRIPQPDSEYYNRIENIDEKVSLFKTTFTSTNAQFTLPTNVHRLGNIGFLNPEGDTANLQRLDVKDFNLVNQSKLTRPSVEFPVYVQKGNEITVYPTTLQFGSIVIDYIRKPEVPFWNYNIGSQGQYTYQSNGSQQFEISAQDQTELILKILAYAGVIIRDPSIVQTATQMVNADNVEEKR